MTVPASGDVRILASTTARFTCRRPETVLKHGDHTPLSQAIHETVTSLLDACETMTSADRTTVGVLGVSRSGELHTLSGIARKFGDQGIYSIDPVVFSKANQFFTVFAICKQFNVLGATSTLFTSASLSTDVLYFAGLLLRQGPTRHIIALSYDEDLETERPPATDGDDRTAVGGRVCAMLLGVAETDGPGSTILSRCRMGPYLPRAGRRSEILETFLARVGAEENGSPLFLGSDRDLASIERIAGGRGFDGVLTSLGPDEAALPRFVDLLDTVRETRPDASRITVHVIPPDKGNVLTAECRFQ